MALTSDSFAAADVVHIVRTSEFEDATHMDPDGADAVHDRNEDGEVWDSAGRLVAQSCQLALTPLT